MAVQGAEATLVKMPRLPHALTMRPDQRTVNLADQRGSGGICRLAGSTPDEN